VITAASLPGDWDQFRRLLRGSGRRFLTTVMASPDADPIPFVIWSGALALAPPLLTAIRTAVRLGMTGNASVGVISDFVTIFRIFFVVYALLIAFLVTALIWEALLPTRDDQDIVGVLPVRPTVLALSRLAAGCQVIIGFALMVSIPVAVIFGGAASTQPGIGSLPRVLAAHVLTTLAASCSVFFTLAALRAVTAVAGGERLASRIASVLQCVTILMLVEAFLFLPGIMAEVTRTIPRGGAVPVWYAPPLWFAALYGWIAEGGVRSHDVDMALLAVTTPMLLAIGLTVLPAARVAKRVQESLPVHTRSWLTTAMRWTVMVATRSAAVRGIVLFTCATFGRSRRHAAILASYIGMSFAMALVGLLTAGFTHRFNITAPRQDNLAVPLVFLFFAVYGLRTAMSRPADNAANWPFRIAPPTVRTSRRAARIVLVTCGVGPVLTLTALMFVMIWPPGIAARVLLLDAAAGLLLVEIAIATWTRIPCASLHVVETSTVQSKWPLQVLTLYLFAFRGADVAMVALRRPGGVLVTVAAIAAVIAALRVRGRGRTERLVIDPEPDALQSLRLHEEPA
jgi:hypothetical protein